MREIQTEININAPMKKVWDVLVDFNNWSQWNPIVNMASGNATNGAKLTITMISKEGKGGKDGPKYNPVIITFEEPRLFRWRAKMLAGFLFTNDKVFELKETDTGTQLIHVEAFAGLIVPLFWRNLQQQVPSMLNSMNQALKKSIETSST